MLRLFIAVIPLTGTIILFVFISKKTARHAEGISAEKLFGMRAPTEDEAELIRRQVTPRNRRKIIVSCMIFVPVCVIATGVYLTQVDFSTLWKPIGFGFFVFGVYALFFGFLSAPLSDQHSLKKRHYAVCDCTIKEIRSYYRHTRTSFSRKEFFQIVVQDDKGYVWVGAMPKDLEDVSEGTRCLLIIYDSEDKINAGRKNGMPVFRREIVVPYYSG